MGKEKNGCHNAVLNRKMAYGVTAFAALIAVATTLKAYGYDDNGDIRSLVARSATVYFPNAGSPLQEGEDFYILVRLVNQDYQKGSDSHPWMFCPTSAWIDSRYLTSYMYMPKLGISVGGQHRYAEYSDYGPWGEKSGRNPNYPIFTELYFKYTVQPGDLGLPVKLICKDGKVPDELSNVDLDLVNVNTATLSLPTNPWKLCNLMSEGGRLVNFHLGPNELRGCPDEPVLCRDYTLKNEGVYVKTIDFDSDYADADDGIWRMVYPKSAEYVLKAPSIKVEGPATAYIWSGDTNVFDVYSANDGDIARISGTNFLRVVIGSGVNSMTFRLKGGAAPAGSKAKIYMTSAAPDAVSAIGEKLESCAVWRTVSMVSPPPAVIRMSFDWDGVERTRKVYPIPDCPAAEMYDRSFAVPMYITLSQSHQEAFHIKLKSKVYDAPSVDVFAAKYLGISAGGGSMGYLDQLTEVVVPANAKQIVVWLYPLGADITTQNGISFDPEIVEPAVQEKYGTMYGCTLSLYDCKPTVVSPTAADLLSADKRMGCEIPIMITDSYRDLNAPQVYTVEYMWAGGGTAGTVEDVSFRAGQATTIMAQGVASNTTGVKIRVKDAQGNFSSWSETVPVFIEPTKIVVPEFVRTASKTAAAVERLCFGKGESAYLRFSTLPRDYTTTKDMYAFLVPLNTASSNLVVTTAFTQGVLIPAGDCLSDVTAAIRFLAANEDLRYGVELRTSPTHDQGERIDTYIQQTAYVCVTNVITEVESPVIHSGQGETFVGIDWVSIDCETEGSTIYFSTNGVPRITEKYLYKGPFEIDGTTTVYALAVCGAIRSEVSTMTFMARKITLAEAIGLPAHTVRTGGDAIWHSVFEQTSTNGGLAARSGVMPVAESGQINESWMELDVDMCGTLSFDWKVDCEDDGIPDATWDRLVVFVDGEALMRIDGRRDWERVKMKINGYKKHCIRWVYIKDDYDEDFTGEDCGWISNVVWMPNSEPLPELPDTATEDEVKTALRGFVDPNVFKNIKDVASYNRFREWSTQFGFQAIMGSENTWLSYALDSEALIAKAPTDGDLKVERFEPTATRGAFDFTIGIGNISVGENADPNNLVTVLGVEGGSSLKSMSISEVNINFGNPEKGKVKLTAGPKDTARPVFFMKVKMSP